MAPEQLTVYNNGEKAVEQRLETLVARGDNLVKYLQNKHSDSCEHKLCYGGRHNKWTRYVANS